MKYHQLPTNNRTNKTRAGRGIAAGRGKTAGRGTKGQKSRTGSKTRPGFEGGQSSLIHSLPKLPGFRSHRKPAQVVYTGQLDTLKTKKVNNQTLAEAGLVDTEFHTVKLITKGDLTKPLEIKLQAASASAVEMVQKSGGSFEVVAKPQRPSKTESKDK